MNPLLSYEWVEAPSSQAEEVVIMLHGILGIRRNLFGFARQFVARFPHLRVLLVDHRNHGESRGFLPPHTLQACADDLDALTRSLGFEPRSIIGHSFGAGVTFTYAKTKASSSLKSVWLLDAAPRLSAETEVRVPNDIVLVLEALKGCSQKASKVDFETCLKSKGLSPAMCSWLSMSRPDPFLAEEMVLDYKKNYVLNEFRHLRPDLRVYMVKAERNESWKGQISEELKKLVKTGNIKEFTLKDAGHYVHMDNPGGILGMMEADFA